MSKLQKPRAVWIMVPAGDATEAQIAELMEHLEPGDTIIDGGNTNFHDDQRRQPELAAKGIKYIDAGTSGGVPVMTIGNDGPDLGQAVADGDDVVSAAHRPHPVVRTELVGERHDRR